MCAKTMFQAERHTKIFLIYEIPYMDDNFEFSSQMVNRIIFYGLDAGFESIAAM